MAKVDPGITTQDAPLLNMEQGMFLSMAPGVTTLQFYKGDSKNAATYLSARLNSVVAVNPWLAGRLVKVKKKGAIRWSTSPGTDAADLFRFDENWGAASNLGINEDMAYAEIAKILKNDKTGTHIQPGGTLIKKKLPLLKVTLSDTSHVDRGNTFVVVISISHLVGNASTIYAIANMLSHDSEIIALSPIRKQELSNKVPDLVGKKSYKSMLGDGPAIRNFLGDMCCGAKTFLHCYEVDDEKLAAAKAAAKDNDLGVEFVSTNDVLTSGFGNATKADMLNMAFDIRGRVKGLSVLDAGNYHAGLMFDKQDYASPAGIRKCMTQPPPHSNFDARFPSASKRAKAKFVMISSWASVCKGEIRIPDCSQTLHLPYIDLKASGNMSMAVVFKSAPGKTAMMLALRKTDKDFMDHLPLGKSVMTERQEAPTLFPQ